jgi:hypothetical protein
MDSVFPIYWNDFSTLLGIGWSRIAFTMLRYDQCIPPVVCAFIIKWCWFFQRILYLRWWWCDFCSWLYLSAVLLPSVYVEPTLHSWNETQLYNVYNILNVLFNAVCKYFIEDFCMYVHWGILSIIFFVCVYLHSYLFWVSVTGFVKWI